MSEVMVCKFDDKIQCVNYACEEDISTLETTKMECALHARIVAANKKLDSLMEILPKGKDLLVIINIKELHQLKAILSQEDTGEKAKT